MIRCVTYSLDTLTPHWYVLNEHFDKMCHYGYKKGGKVVKDNRYGEWKLLIKLNFMLNKTMYIRKGYLRRKRMMRCCFRLYRLHSPKR